MTDYNCYDYALELGFTEAEARALQASKDGKGQPDTTLRWLATVKGLRSMKPAYPMPPEATQSTTSPSTSIDKGKAPVKRKTRRRAKPVGR